MRKKGFWEWLSKAQLPEGSAILYKRIHTTFILGTALQNFGTRANNIGRGTLDFCRVKANFSARVPKNLGGPRPPPL